MPWKNTSSCTEPLRPVKRLQRTLRARAPTAKTPCPPGNRLTPLRPLAAGSVISAAWTRRTSTNTSGRYTLTPTRSGVRVATSCSRTRRSTMSTCRGRLERAVRNSTCAPRKAVERFSQSWALGGVTSVITTLSRGRRATNAIRWLFQHA
jgi:hypothetical protein